MLTKMTEEDWGACARGVRCLPLAAWGQGAGRPQVFRSLALFHGPQHYVARHYVARHYVASAAGRVRLLEQHLEALLALEPQRRVRNFLRSARLLERAGASRADVRLDRHPRACVGGRRKRGQDGEALGRSRGGFSTKIHLKTDLDGYPIGFHLTGGEASDSRNFEVLLDLGPDVDPRAVVADKGYDAKTNREAARKRGICPVIPYRSVSVVRVFGTRSGLN